MISKPQLDLANKIILQCLKEHKVTASAKSLCTDYYVGTHHPSKKIFSYTNQDRVLLKALLDREGILGVSEFKGSRNDVAKNFVHEKRSTQPVIKNSILIRNICGTPCVNGVDLNIPTSGHLRINLSDITDIRATTIIVIENLAVFNVFETSMFTALEGDVVAIFRGGPKDDEVNGVTNNPRVNKKDFIHPEVFAESLKLKTGVRLIGYFDYDLAGLVMMTHSKYDGCILPLRLDDLKDLKHNQDDYRNQHDKFLPSEGRVRSFLYLPHYLDYILNTVKGSFTQERLVASHIQMCIVQLIVNKPS